MQEVGEAMQVVGGPRPDERVPVVLCLLEPFGVAEHVQRRERHVEVSVELADRGGFRLGAFGGLRDVVGAEPKRLG